MMLKRSVKLPTGEGSDGLGGEHPPQRRHGAADPDNREGLQPGACGVFHFCRQD